MFTHHQVNVSTHPVVQELLTGLRSKNTDTEGFRKLLPAVSTLLIADATRLLKTDTLEVETPLGKARGHRIVEEVAFIPVWRAGEAMLTGALTLFPRAKVLHAGVARDEQTLTPGAYYWKPGEKLNSSSTCIVLEQMIATGGTVDWIVSQLKTRGVKRICVVALIAAQPGIGNFHHSHPEIPLYVAAVDPELNERGYIVPGLGDAGDRYFGT